MKTSIRSILCWSAVVNQKQWRYWVEKVDLYYLFLHGCKNACFFFQKNLSNWKEGNYNKEELDGDTSSISFINADTGTIVNYNTSKKQFELFDLQSLKMVNIEKSLFSLFIPQWNHTIFFYSR